MAAEVPGRTLKRFLLQPRHELALVDIASDQRPAMAPKQRVTSVGHTHTRAR